MCASRLLGMGGDSFANAKSGVGDVGGLLLLACMGGCLTIFKTCLCPVYLVEELVTVFHAPV